MGPSPALCSLPAPAQLGLPVCHREPDVPSYHLWGSVQEICGEKGQVRQAKGALLGTACACDLLSQTSQARAVRRDRHMAEGQFPEPASNQDRDGQARPEGASVVTLTLGPPRKQMVPLSLRRQFRNGPREVSSIGGRQSQGEDSSSAPPRLLHFLADAPTGHQSWPRLGKREAA